MDKLSRTSSAPPELEKGKKSEGRHREERNESRVKKKGYNRHVGTRGQQRHTHGQGGRKPGPQSHQRQLPQRGVPSFPPFPMPPFGGYTPQMAGRGAAPPGSGGAAPNQLVFYPTGAYVHGQGRGPPRGPGSAAFVQGHHGAYVPQPYGYPPPPFGMPGMGNVYQPSVAPPHGAPSPHGMVGGVGGGGANRRQKQSARKATNRPPAKQHGTSHVPRASVAPPPSARPRKALQITDPKTGKVITFSPKNKKSGEGSATRGGGGGVALDHAGHQHMGAQGPVASAPRSTYNPYASGLPYQGFAGVPQFFNGSQMQAQQRAHPRARQTAHVAQANIRGFAQDQSQDSQRRQNAQHKHTTQSAAHAQPPTRFQNQEPPQAQQHAQQRRGKQRQHRGQNHIHGRTQSAETTRGEKARIGSGGQGSKISSGPSSSVPPPETAAGEKVALKKASSDGKTAGAVANGESEDAPEHGGQKGDVADRNESSVACASTELHDPGTAPCKPPTPHLSYAAMAARPNRSADDVAARECDGSLRGDSGVENVGSGIEVMGQGGVAESALRQAEQECQEETGLPANLAEINNGREQAKKDANARLRRAEQERQEEARLAANLAEINKRREQAKKDANARKLARERLERLEQNDVPAREDTAELRGHTGDVVDHLADGTKNAAELDSSVQGSDGTPTENRSPVTRAKPTAVPHFKIGRRAGAKQIYTIAELRKLKSFFPYGSLESCKRLPALGVPMQYEIVSSTQHARQNSGRHSSNRNHSHFSAQPRSAAPKPKGGLRNPIVKGGAVVGQGGAARNARLGIRSADPRSSGGNSRFASGPFGGTRMGMGSSAFQQPAQPQPRGGASGGRMGMGSARGKAGNAANVDGSSDWRSAPRRQVVAGTGDPFCINPVTLHKAEKAWKPSESTDASSIEKWKRKIGAILNKLSRENFNKLADDMLNMPMESLEMLKETMNIIFDKALSESFYSDMYADLCRELSMHSATWNFTQVKSVDDPDTGIPKYFWAARINPTERDLIGPYATAEEARAKAKKETSFKRILLNKCQEEFEKEDLYNQAEEAYKVLLRSAEYGSLGNDEKVRRKLKYNAKRKDIKKRMLGNVQFIGELFKQGMLTERIMHECILKMLGGRDGNGAAMRNPDGEEVEALCKLVTTIGQKLDHERAKNYMGVYFCRLRLLSKHPKLEPRAKFMCSDLIDLRKNKWVPRRKAMVKARTKAEVRAEAEDEERRKEKESRHGSRYGGGGSNFDRRRGRGDRSNNRDRRSGRSGPSVQSRRDQSSRTNSQDIRNAPGERGQHRAKRNEESAEKARASGELAGNRGKALKGKQRGVPGRGSSGPSKDGRAKRNNMPASSRGKIDEVRVAKLIRMDLGDLVDGNTQYEDLVKNIKSTIKEGKGSALFVEQTVAYEAIEMAVTKCFGKRNAPKVDLLCDVLVRMCKDRHIGAESIEKGIKAVTQKIEEIAEDAPLSKDIFARILSQLITNGGCVSLKAVSDALACLVEDEYSSSMARSIGGAMLSNMIKPPAEDLSGNDVPASPAVMKLLEELSPADIDAWIVPEHGKVDRDRFISDFKLEPLRAFFARGDLFSSQLCSKLREGRSVDDLIAMLSTPRARESLVGSDVNLSRGVTLCILDYVTTAAGTKACSRKGQGDGSAGGIDKEKAMMEDYARLLMNITHARPDTKAEAQMQCLLGVHAFCSRHECLQCAPRMFKILYGTSVVQEDIFIEWFDQRGSAVSGFDALKRETASFISFLRKTPCVE